AKTSTASKCRSPELTANKPRPKRSGLNSQTFTVTQKYMSIKLTRPRTERRLQAAVFNKLAVVYHKIRSLPRKRGVPARVSKCTDLYCLLVAKWLFPLFCLRRGSLTSIVLALMVFVTNLHAATKIAADGKSSFRIIIPAQSLPAERHAAEELQ